MLCTEFKTIQEADPYYSILGLSNVALVNSNQLDLHLCQLVSVPPFERQKLLLDADGKEFNVLGLDLSVNQITQMNNLACLANLRYGLQSDIILQMHDLQTLRSRQCGLCFLRSL